MALGVLELEFLVTAVAKCKREASAKASGTCGHPYTVLAAASEQVVGDKHIEDGDHVEVSDREEDEASCKEEDSCSSFRGAEDRSEAEAGPCWDPFGAYRFEMPVVSLSTAVGYVVAG